MTVQPSLFEEETTDDDVRAWASAVGLDCPRTGPVPESLREAHADPTIDVGPWVCRWCGQEEGSSFALGNNHWTPRGADLCIAMDLTRNHVAYFAQALSGQHDPRGCVSATCRHRSLDERCARGQLERAVLNVGRVWPRERLTWLATVLTAAGLAPDVVEDLLHLTEYALEADPGRCTASHPTFTDLAAARVAASAPAMHRDGLPPVRVLQRPLGGSWLPIRAEAA